MAPATRAYVALCEAEHARLAGSASWEACESAAADWESLGHPYLEGYARWRQAEALFALRRARDGTAALRIAHGLAQRIGAEPLAREIAMLARRARVQLPIAAAIWGQASQPDPGAASNGADGADGIGLTPRQLEVLAVIAAGMTNREIAQTLFITEKTAGAHVSSIQAVLGVRSRVEAATTAHRLGLIQPTT